MLFEQCSAGESISSLAWLPDGEYLAAALTPTAEILFFKVNNDEVIFLGRKASNFLEGSFTHLTTNKQLSMIIVTARKADIIQVRNIFTL